MKVKDNQFIRDKFTPYMDVSSEFRRKSVNLNTLMRKVKEDQKKDKKNNLIFVTTALAILAISGIIISL
jgi:hypothetical protein